jgi:hypothetical protein
MLTETGFATLITIEAKSITRANRTIGAQFAVVRWKISTAGLITTIVI